MLMVGLDKRDWADATSMISGFTFIVRRNLNHNSRHEKLPLTCLCIKTGPRLATWRHIELKTENFCWWISRTCFGQISFLLINRPRIFTKYWTMRLKVAVKNILFFIWHISQPSCWMDQLKWTIFSHISQNGLFIETTKTT